MCAPPTPLMGRIAIEFRTDQKAWDIAADHTINKVPPPMMAQVSRRRPRICLEARDRSRRWYGVYANYNSPAYNTKLVKAEELPKTYEEFAGKSNGPAGRDRRHRQRMAEGDLEHYGEQKAPRSSKGSWRRSSRSSPTAISRWRAPPAPANTRSRSTTTSICR